MMGNAFYNYTHAKNRLIEQLKFNSEISLTQLKNTVAPYMEAYAIHEYEKLMVNEMAHKDILAVFIEDYNMSKIMGEQKFITGMIRDEAWSIVEFDHQNSVMQEQLKNALSLQTSEVISQNGVKLGEITIYNSNRLIKSELRELIVQNLLASVVLSLLLIITLLIAIRQFILKPISDIVDAIAHTDSEGIPTKMIPLGGAKEISLLSSMMKRMIRMIKSSREKLKGVEKDLKAAQTIANVGHFSFDHKSSLFKSSEQLDKIYGLIKEEEKSYEHWLNIIYIKDREAIDTYYQEVYNSLSEFNKEFRVINAQTQELKWVHCIGRFIKDENSENLTLFGTVQDITERKLFETQLLQAQTVFDNTHDGIMVTDENVKMINVNKAFEKMTGYSKEDVLGLNPNVLKSDKQDSEFYNEMWHQINTYGYWSGEIQNRTKTGELFTEILTVNAVYENDELINYIGIFSDISLQKEQEKILLQQSRTAAVGEMIGNIAHQWRQPLSVISTASSGLTFALEIDQAPSKEEMIEALQMISDHTQHLSKTIDDFRNFFRGDLSQNVEFNIKHTIRRVNELTHDMFSNNYILYHENLEEDIIVEQNENILIQALLNIYNNAKDALIENCSDEKRRHFFVDVKRVDDCIEIRMRNTGGSIPSNIIEKIFEPYFTTKHESVGTGIGLYMTHQIITKQLKGTISVENVNIEYNSENNEGVEFVIRFGCNH